MTTNQVLLLIGGGVFGLIMKIVFDWLKNSRGRKANGYNGHAAKIEECLKKLLEDVQWIREIHDRRDENGVPIWYVPRDWKRQLNGIQRTLYGNSEMLRRIIREEITNPGIDD